MAGIFRAYGQLRRGTGPWRTPFLIPVGDLVPPFIQGSSNVAIDTGATAPDLRIALIIDSLDQFPTIAVKFRIQPMPGRTLSDITLRIALLKDGDSPFLDSGPLEPDAGFAFLQYRVPPTQVMPGELSIQLFSGFGWEDPADPAPEPATLSGRNTPTTVQVSAVKIYATSSSSDDLDLAGGLVSGPMVHLAGVETAFNSIAGTGYGEIARQIRGIVIDRLDDRPPSGATLPESATWFDLRAANPTMARTELGVDLRLPIVGPKPTAAPTCALIPGGTLRPGTYRYRTTFLQGNGNESPLGDRSGPVTVTSTSGNAVRVSWSDVAPPAPGPDVHHVGAIARRVYRTDCDHGTDVDAGDRGDDVLVDEVPLTDTSLDDTGPVDPTQPPSLPHDLIAIRYRSTQRLDLSGGLRLLDGTADERFGGAVSGAPTRVRVVYQPGSEPLLRWSANDTTPLLSVGMPGLSTPFGLGLAATLTTVPVTFALHWTILGSEYFGLAAAGRATTVAGGVPAEIGQLAVRMGPAALPPAPPTWPDGEAEIAIEVADEDSGTPFGLIALHRLRRATVSSGGLTWALREPDAGRLAAHLELEPAAPNHDRRLRVARRSGGEDPLPSLDLTAHLVPDLVEVTLVTPPKGSGLPTTLDLPTRLRWVRARLVARMEPEGTDPPGRLEGEVLADDTTDHLTASIASSIALSTGWPVRVGGRLRTVAADPVDDVVVRPDVIVPTKVSASTVGDVLASATEPGLSGRVALSMGSEHPLAVRANPQVKLVSNGSADPPDGLRAATARVLGVTGASVPDALFKAVGKPAVEPADEVAIAVSSSADRANGSFRAEVQAREQRVVAPPDDRAVAGVRSWLRARTAHLPNQVDVSARLLVDGAGAPDVGGAALATSEPWGAGVVWAEPGFTREPLGELGADKGIGLITAGFESIPSHLELWQLDRATRIGSRVPSGDALPSVGPVGTDWEPGGAVLRLDGPLRLSHVQLALPGGDRRVCRNDGGPNRPVRTTTWAEVIGPFVKLEPTGSTLTELVIWSTGEPSGPAPDPMAPEPDPCAPAPAGDGRKTALGWRIAADLRLSMALRIYDLGTPSGAVTARWWSMPTSSETWGGTSIDCGEWELQQELQMRDYQGLVALYPKSKTDNPFGDWEAGPGTWWLRQRGGLDVPLFLVFGPDISSGDVFMGNVGGGYHMIGTNGIFSTLPAIWSWSYP